MSVYPPPKNVGGDFNSDLFWTADGDKANFPTLQGTLTCPNGIKFGDGSFQNSASSGSGGATPTLDQVLTANGTSTQNLTAGVITASNNFSGDLTGNADTATNSAGAFIINETTGTFGSASGGSLTLSHDDSPGANSIVFKNTVDTSNFASIKYIDNIEGLSASYPEFADYDTVLQSAGGQTNSSVLAITTDDNVLQSNSNGGDSMVIRPSSHLILDTGNTSGNRNGNSLIMVNPTGANGGCLIVGKQSKTISNNKLEVEGDSRFEGGIVVTGSSTFASGNYDVALPSITADDILVTRNSIDTLTNKTLTDPDVTGLTAIGDGSSNPGQIQLNCKANTHALTLKGPAHTNAVSYSLQFPSAQGTNNQVLKNNGSGVLSWSDFVATTPTLDEVLTTNASSSYFGTVNLNNATISTQNTVTSTSAAIGTSYASAPLHVVKDDGGNENIVEVIRLERTCGYIDDGPNDAQGIPTAPGEGGFMGLYVSETLENPPTSLEAARISWRADNADNTDDDGRLGFWTNNNGTIAQRMTITKEGKVGIATTSPTKELEVDGTVKANTIELKTTTVNATYPAGSTTVEIDAGGASYATFNLDINVSTGNRTISNYTFTNTVNNGQYVLCVKVTSTVASNYVRIEDPGSSVTNQFWGYSASNYDAYNGEHVLVTFYVFNNNTYISLAPFS